MGFRRTGFDISVVTTGHSEVSHLRKVTWGVTFTLLRLLEDHLLHKLMEDHYISYHLFFPCIPKVSCMLHHGSVGRVHSKECYYNL